METSAEIYRCQPSADRTRSYEGDYRKAGKEAEEIVLNWLTNWPGIIGLDDLRDLRPMQKADCDAAIYTLDGRVALCEIKSDWHLGISPNILFEVLRINHTAAPDLSVTLGWAARSPAKWLLCYAPQRQEIWMCTFARLREDFQRYTRTARQETKFRWISTDAIKSTLVALLPVAEAKCFRQYALDGEEL